MFKTVIGNYLWACRFQLLMAAIWIPYNYWASICMVLPTIPDFVIIYREYKKVINER